jgi:hypothetical protein
LNEVRGHKRGTVRPEKVVAQLVVEGNLMKRCD